MCRFDVKLYGKKDFSFSFEIKMIFISCETEPKAELNVKRAKFKVSHVQKDVNCTFKIYDSIIKINT